VANIEAARALVSQWPDQAQALAEAHWPGPLTLVLPKQPHVPGVVTAGLPTVGVRIPRHDVALALLREAAVPIAAPSANRFTRLSPTRAEHVREAFTRDEVAIVLEGGISQVGIESTVISLAGSEPLVLRPGTLTFPQYRSASEPGAGAHASPGQHHAHYQPRSRVVLVAGPGALPEGSGAALWHSQPLGSARDVRMSADASAYAAALYDTLHALDAEGWAWIAIEPPPAGPAWDGVRDRLMRAAPRG
jgi:L-threonylcarbamoyladenylate synthase